MAHTDRLETGAVRPIAVGPISGSNQPMSRVGDMWRVPDDGIETPRDEELAETVPIAHDIGLGFDPSIEAGQR